jgi:hypothetical protein
LSQNKIKDPEMRRASARILWQTWYNNPPSEIKFLAAMSSKRSSLFIPKPSPEPEEEERRPSFLKDGLMGF